MMMRLPKMTFAEARTANEILKAQERLIKMDIMRGKLCARPPKCIDEK